MNYLLLSQSFYPTMSLLFSNESLIYSVIQYPNEQYPNNLIFVTKTMFDVLKIDKKDPGGIFVVYGPGSFTGTRISVVDAKILAYSLSVPLYPINSLELTAAHVSGKVSTILSASRNEFFVADFEDGKRISDVEIVDLEKIVNEDKTFVSFEKLENFKSYKQIFPDVEVIRKFCLNLVLKKQLIEDPLSLEPLYLRAEEKLFKKIR